MLLYQSHVQQAIQCKCYKITAECTLQYLRSDTIRKYSFETNRLALTLQQLCVVSNLYCMLSQQVQISN